jgi:hypothetical protein
MTTPQRWVRKGLIYSPRGERPWLHSHTSAPVAVPAGGSRYRVYFASRDAENRSNAGSVVIDLDDPSASPVVADEPTLAPGPLGNFDDHGIYPTSIVVDGGTQYMFYAGFSPGSRSHLFYASIGLAVSEDGGRSFERVSAVPIVARSEFDPCLVTAPSVIRDGGMWRMWYVSGYRWETDGDGEAKSWYDIKYAESDNGVDWRREGHVCLSHEHEGERNISRTCVVKDGDLYRAWYSYGGDFPYRLGYAESPDGYQWTRLDDQVDLDPPAGEWDSESRSYPWVFRHRRSLAMLYCGNQLGRDGFGLAIDEPSA